MSLYIPNEGEIIWLKRMLYADGAGAMENITLRLTHTNHTPAETDTSATYAAATFTTYADKTLTSSQAAGTWAIPTSVAPTGGWAPAGNTNVAESTYNSGTPQSWSCGATGDTVYGYVYIGVTSTKLLGAELFGTPRALANGDSLSLTPRIGCAHS